MTFNQLYFQSSTYPTTSACCTHPLGERRLLSLSPHINTIDSTTTHTTLNWLCHKLLRGYPEHLRARLSELLSLQAQAPAHDRPLPSQEGAQSSTTLMRREDSSKFWNTFLQHKTPERLYQEGSHDLSAGIRHLTCKHPKLNTFHSKRFMNTQPCNMGTIPPSNHLLQWHLTQIAPRHHQIFLHCRCPTKRTRP